MKVERSISEAFHVDSSDQIQSKSRLPIKSSNNTCRYYGLFVDRMNYNQPFSFRDLKIYHLSCCCGRVSIKGLIDGNFILMCERCLAQTIVLCPNETVTFIQMAIDQKANVISRKNETLYLRPESSKNSYIRSLKLKAENPVPQIRFDFTKKKRR